MDQPLPDCYLRQIRPKNFVVWDYFKIMLIVFVDLVVIRGLNFECVCVELYILYSRKKLPIIIFKVKILNKSLNC